MQTDKTQKLFEENERLVYSTVNRRFNSPNFHDVHGLTLDDLYQYGRLGLLRACETYDKSKNTKFSSYAMSNIAWSISVESKRDSLGNKTTANFDLLDRTSLDRELPQADDVNTTLYDILESYEAGYNDVEFDDLLNRMDKQLPKALSTAVRMRLDGHVYEEIADALGVSQQAVRQRLKLNRSKIVDLLMI